jgi:hypothetical protein
MKGPQNDCSFIRRHSYRIAKCPRMPPVWQNIHWLKTTRAWRRCSLTVIYIYIYICIIICAILANLAIDQGDRGGSQILHAQRLQRRQLVTSTTFMFFCHLRLAWCALTLGLWNVTTRLNIYLVLRHTGIFGTEELQIIEFVQLVLSESLGKGRIAWGHCGYLLALGRQICLR